MFYFNRIIIQKMDQKLSHQKNSQIDDNSSQNLLVYSNSSKRLIRKPSNKYINTPKSRRISIFDNDSFKIVDIQKSQHKKLNILLSQNNDYPQNYIGQNLDPIKNFCYISPRNCQSSKRFMRMPPKKSLGNKKQQQFSIDSIETNSFIQLKQNIQLPSKNKISIKNTLSKTVRQNGELKKSPNQIMSQSHVPILKFNQLDNLKEENKDLINQNISLNTRIKDLKQENQYLYKQIQTLNNLLIQERSEYQKIKRKNNQLQEDIRSAQQEIKLFKQEYIIKQQNSKSYQIIEHIYLKTKNQLQQVIKKNKSLIIQNEKFSNKIAYLSKMLQNCPIQLINSMKKIKSQTKSKELIEIVNKQNYESKQLCYQRFQTLNTPKANRRSQKQNFFQLSPQ